MGSSRPFVSPTLLDNCANMLPSALVQPVIVKNTFLDFDDGCLKRTRRRCKTEGTHNRELPVEYYDPSDCDSTSSTTSVFDQSSTANSEGIDGACVEDTFS